MRKENILKARHCLAQIAAIEEQLASGFVVLANGRSIPIPQEAKDAMTSDLAAIQVKAVDAVNDV
jgi:ribose 1,5-bisphosphokinase PhnN